MPLLLDDNVDDEDHDDDAFPFHIIVSSQNL